MPLNVRWAVSGAGLAGAGAGASVESVERPVSSYFDALPCADGRAAQSESPFSGPGPSVARSSITLLTDWAADYDLTGVAVRDVPKAEAAGFRRAC